MPVLDFSEVRFSTIIWAHSILQCLEIVENSRKSLLYLKTTAHSMHGPSVVTCVLISPVTGFIQKAMSANRNATFFFLNNRKVCILLFLSLYALIGSKGGVWSPSLKLFYDTTAFSIFEGFFFNYFLIFWRED